jgi:nucleotide-binding universal stress UspA family protein
MIKTILVPISGNSSNASVFETALAVAKPLRSHLDFYRARFSAAEAAARSPHAGFCMGRATSEMLKNFERHEQDLSAETVRHFNSFCRVHGILECAAPQNEEQPCVSAHLTQEAEHSASRLLSRGRHSDLIVLGRSGREDLPQENLIEWLLLGSGHPVVVAPEVAPEVATGRPFRTIVVGWQETAAAARSVSAAIPLLRLAEKVYLLIMVESRDASAETIAQVTHQLSLHGVSAQTSSLIRAGRRVSEDLLDSVAELDADLLVVGAFDHKPLWEALFGGVTHSLLQH